MTRDTILTLTGPALSEAVARHVMRWRRIPSEAMNSTASVWEDPRDKSRWFLIPCRPMPKRDQGFFGIVAETWEPHQDMGAAWMVWTVAPGDEKTLRASSDRFQAVIDAGEPVDAESAELAICRAALLAALTPADAVGSGASVLA